MTGGSKGMADVGKCMAGFRGKMRDSGKQEMGDGGKESFGREDKWQVVARIMSNR